jgi:hypothetical protein
MLGAMRLVEIIKARLREGRSTAPQRTRSASHFAYKQADLLRQGRTTHDEAVAAIARRHPSWTPKQVADELARGLHDSR